MDVCYIHIYICTYVCASVRNTKIFDFSRREAKENEPTTNPKKTLRIRRKHLAIAITYSLSLSLPLSSYRSLVFLTILPLWFTWVFTHMHVSTHVHTYVFVHVCVDVLDACPWVWSLLVCWGECCMFFTISHELKLCRKFSFFIRLLLYIMPAHWYSLCTYTHTYVCTLYIAASTLPWDSWLIAAWRLSAIAFSNSYCLWRFRTSVCMRIHMYVCMYVVYFCVVKRIQCLRT